MQVQRIGCCATLLRINKKQRVLYSCRPAREHEVQRPAEAFSLFVHHHLSPAVWNAISRITKIHEAASRSVPVAALRHPPSRLSDLLMRYAHDMKRDADVEGAPGVAAQRLEPLHVCVIGLRGIPDVIGGIEAHCERLYPEIRTLDPTISVTLLIRRGYTKASRFNYRGLDIIALWSPILWGVDTLIHTAWALIYARFRVHPDVVHIHGIGPAFFTPLARLLGFRTIVTHHAADYERPKWTRRGRAFLKIGERMAGYFANRIVCVSQAQLHAFLDKVPIAARRSTVIRHAGGIEDLDLPNSSDVLDRLGVGSGRYVLAVGRLEATKGFHDLVQACERADLGDTKLVIVGSDAGNLDYAVQLRAHASERIVFAGYQSGADLRRLYQSASLFVHPSYMEGFALVVSEALSADIPMLVSDIPPHREFGLEDSCYVPASDVEALVEALEVPDYRVYRSQMARSRQKTTSWSSVARRHIDIFREVAKRRLF